MIQPVVTTPPIGTAGAPARALQYYMRLDTDSELTAPLPYDIFDRFAAHGWRYGYRSRDVAQAGPAAPATPGFEFPSVQSDPNASGFHPSGRRLRRRDVPFLPIFLAFFAILVEIGGIASWY